MLLQSAEVEAFVRKAWASLTDHQNSFSILVHTPVRVYKAGREGSGKAWLQVGDGVAALLEEHVHTSPSSFGVIRLVVLEPLLTGESKVIVNLIVTSSLLYKPDRERPWFHQMRVANTIIGLAFARKDEAAEFGKKVLLHIALSKSNSRQSPPSSPPVESRARSSSWSNARRASSLRSSREKEQALPALPGQQGLKKERTLMPPPPVPLRPTPRSPPSSPSPSLTPSESSEPSSPPASQGAGSLLPQSASKASKRISVSLHERREPPPPPPPPLSHSAPLSPGTPKSPHLVSWPPADAVEPAPKDSVPPPLPPPPSLSVIEESASPATSSPIVAQRAASLRQPPPQTPKDEESWIRRTSSFSGGMQHLRRPAKPMVATPPQVPPPPSASVLSPPQSAAHVPAAGPPPPLPPPPTVSASASPSTVLHAPVTSALAPPPLPPLPVGLQESPKLPAAPQRPAVLPKPSSSPGTLRRGSESSAPTSPAAQQAHLSAAPPATLPKPQRSPPVSPRSPPSSAHSSSCAAGAQARFFPSPPSSPAAQSPSHISEHALASGAHHPPASAAAAAPSPVSAHPPPPPPPPPPSILSPTTAATLSPGAAPPAPPPPLLAAHSAPGLFDRTGVHPSKPPPGDGTPRSTPLRRLSDTSNTQSNGTQSLLSSICSFNPSSLRCTKGGSEKQAPPRPKNDAWSSLYQLIEARRTVMDPEEESGFHEDGDLPDPFSEDSDEWE